jgi:hypothetical protein
VEMALDAPYGRGGTSSRILLSSETDVENLAKAGVEYPRSRGNVGPFGRALDESRCDSEVSAFAKDIRGISELAGLGNSCRSAMLAFSFASSMIRPSVCIRRKANWKAYLVSGQLPVAHADAGDGPSGHC